MDISGEVQLEVRPFKIEYKLFWIVAAQSGGCDLDCRRCRVRGWLGVGCADVRCGQVQTEVGDGRCTCTSGAGSSRMVAACLFSTRQFLSPYSPWPAGGPCGVQAAAGS